MYKYKCKLCGEEKESLGPMPDELCDGCWELSIRIKSQPDLARKVLTELEEVNNGTN